MFFNSLCNILFQAFSICSVFETLNKFFLVPTQPFSRPPAASSTVAARAPSICPSPSRTTSEPLALRSLTPSPNATANPACPPEAISTSAYPAPPAKASALFLSPASPSPSSAMPMTTSENVSPAVGLSSFRRKIPAVAGSSNSAPRPT